MSPRILIGVSMVLFAGCEAGTVAELPPTDERIAVATATEGASATAGDGPTCEAPPELVTCCLTPCCEDGGEDSGTTGGFGDGNAVGAGTTGGDPETCAPPPKKPPPPEPGDEPDFDCPVDEMPYNCNQPGCDLFDCDDYAYACMRWAEANGYNACQVTVTGDDSNGDGVGHAVVAVEFESDNPPLELWCLIEPQTNYNYGCWYQPDGDPAPPQDVIDDVCDVIDAEEGTCDPPGVTCGDEQVPIAGEACFTTLPEVCEMFQATTGLCSDDFTPLPPPQDPPEGAPVYCTGTDGSGDFCFWDCPTGSSCGSTCDSCEPAE